MAMIEDACLDAVASTENLKKFLVFQNRFEKYSLNNNLLIYMQKPTAVRSRDFNVWIGDIGRAAMITRWGYFIGWITCAKAMQLLFDIAQMAANGLTKWCEFAQSYIFGGAF